MTQQKSAKELLDKIEKISAAHHKHHYNRERFKFEWQTLDHIGIWSYGGKDKDKIPTLAKWTKVCTPYHDNVEGWFCYIGPLPEFTNES